MAILPETERIVYPVERPHTVARIQLFAERHHAILSGVLFGLQFIGALLLIGISMTWSVRYGDGMAVVMAFVCFAYIYLAFGRR